MSNDSGLFADEGEAVRDPSGITHVAHLLIDRRIGLCGTLLIGGRRVPDDNVDCITCIVIRDRFAAGVLR